jgi:hypothetical protein
MMEGKPPATYAAKTMKIKNPNQNQKPNRNHPPLTNKTKRKRNVDLYYPMTIREHQLDANFQTL